VSTKRRPVRRPAILVRDWLLAEMNLLRQQILEP
jgi:hypothetical protein